MNTKYWELDYDTNSFVECDKDSEDADTSRELYDSYISFIFDDVFYSIFNGTYDAIKGYNKTLAEKFWKYSNGMVTALRARIGEIVPYSENPNVWYSSYKDNEGVISTITKDIVYSAIARFFQNETEDNAKILKQTNKV